ncbi:MAG: CotH kinase family protein [Bacteroidales bacterium]|nr:CotH kinase family protein [Bacteroidales bacterium]
MKKYFIILFFLFPLMVHGQLKINEIMSNNVSFIMDDAYNFSMWVEVYNSSSSEAVDLSDYYFTDDLENPYKWQPSSRSVVPYGFDTLWFEREERPGHASFKLDPKGGTLYLLNQNMNIVDYVIYPSQYRNISYGRQTDNASAWVFYEEPSPGSSNNGKKNSAQRCATPVFNLQNGFYSAIQLLSFTIPATDTIYYTTDNSEPAKRSIKYQHGSAISIDSTVVIRAKAFSQGKLSSDVVSSTYFINERKPDLRVVSISTDQRYLTNDTIGIYCDGTNGILGNFQDEPKNFNQDWDRPVNFELFDEAGIPCLNQELDIRILGGGSREKDLKPISISPKKKFCDNQLRYDIFSASKPNHKYRAIQMRNSGNDFKRTMMKDAFLQSLVIGRMDVDYQAYEPAVIFINGEYFGIENMRERCNKDFAFSNFGLDDDEVDLIEATYKGIDSHNDIPTDPGFIELSNFLKNNPMEDDDNYMEACRRIDVDEFINYLLIETYVSNVDWPYNNVKMWKRTVDGKWRWILMDLEYCYTLKRINHNSITFALGENDDNVIGGYDEAPEWSVVVFAELIKNETFQNKLIDRFCVHLSTTLEPARVNQIMNTIADRIRPEMPYHRARFGIADYFQYDLNEFASFANQRNANMFSHISSRFLNNAPLRTIQLSANIPGATYRLNAESIIDSVATISYFKDRDVAISANPIPGYHFSYWIVDGTEYNESIYTGTMDENIVLKAIYGPNSDMEETDAIFINELVSSNQYIPDEMGEKDDYIELYNNSTIDINIAGWYMTDDPLNKTMCKILTTDYSQTVIPAKGRLILWADNQPEQGMTHLDFKIDQDGEIIILSKMNDDYKLLTVDSVKVPVMDANFSYSRITDGNAIWAIQPPTFNLPNDYTYTPEPVVSKVKIYPTLVTESFHIKGAVDASISIIDITGRIRYTGICQSEDEIINISYLQQGLYIVMVESEALKIVKK